MKEKHHIILFMVIGIFHVVYSENKNPVPMLLFNGSSQTSNLDPTVYCISESETEAPEDKNQGKRRTFNMNDNEDINSQSSIEYITRKNFSTDANVKKTFERHDEGYGWNDERENFNQEMNYFGGNENSGFYQGQQERGDSRYMYDWQRRGDNSQQRFNDGQNFQQYALNEFSNAKDAAYNRQDGAYNRQDGAYNRQDGAYNRQDGAYNRQDGAYNRQDAAYNRQDAAYNRQDSGSSMNDYYETKKQENYNNKLLTSTHHRHPIHSSYESARDMSNLNYYGKDKGLVINFNTECPASSQTNNRFVHKYIIPPNSRLISQVETSPFQMPEATVISSAHMTNPIYCYQ